MSSKTLAASQHGRRFTLIDMILLTMKKRVWSAAMNLMFQIHGSSASKLLSHGNAHWSEIKTPHTRKLALRCWAMIMSPDAGGVFDTLLNLVNKGLGGKAGDGRQFVSWIHYEDFVRAILWLVERDEINGVVNLAAPTTDQFRFHARLAWRIRHSIRITSYKTHDGMGCCLHANRNWTFIEESSRCSQKASCEWFQVQLLQIGMKQHMIFIDNGPYRMFKNPLCQ